MTLTNFPNGITSFGVPVVGGGAGPFKPYATYYFVDASNFTGAASDGNDGLSPQSPLLTMARAFAILLSNVTLGSGGSGSVICFIGNVAEQLTTPAGVFDVTVVGCGNSPRHSDAFSGNSGYSAATWKAPSSPTAATPLCRVIQQGWTFTNILFDPPADSSALNFVRNAASGTSERDGSHFTVSGCRFGAGQNHIGISATSFTENVFNGRIVGNTFNDATAASIMAPANVGGWRHQIVGNTFSGNGSNIILPMTQGYIADNDIGLFTTTGISTASGANNVVTKNALTGDYNTDDYASGTSDWWVGNYATVEAVTAPDGVTIAVPAAP
jgi:hypothetical protein